MARMTNAQHAALYALYSQGGAVLPVRTGRALVKLGYATERGYGRIFDVTPKGRAAYRQGLSAA